MYIIVTDIANNDGGTTRAYVASIDGIATVFTLRQQDAMRFDARADAIDSVPVGFRIVRLRPRS